MGAQREKTGEGRSLNTQSHPVIGHQRHRRRGDFSAATQRTKPVCPLDSCRGMKLAVKTRRPRAGTNIQTIPNLLHPPAHLPVCLRKSNLKLSTINSVIDTQTLGLGPRVWVSITPRVWVSSSGRLFTYISTLLSGPLICVNMNHLPTHPSPPLFSPTPSGIPHKSLYKLQLVQKSTARISANHFALVLQHLQWLPVATTLTLGFHFSLLKPATALLLCTSPCTLLHITTPSCSDLLSGFTSAPLPPDIRNIGSLSIFNMCLKAHYYQKYPSSLFSSSGMQTGIVPKLASFGLQ